MATTMPEGIRAASDIKLIPRPVVNGTAVHSKRACSDPLSTGISIGNRDQGTGE